MARRGADLVARALALAGTRQLFALSGNHVMALFDAALDAKLPILHVREGRRNEELLGLIEEDPSIQLLVLGTATGREGPGPLVTYLVSQMGDQMRVPVTLVPGQLTPEEIDEVS